MEGQQRRRPVGDSVQPARHCRPQIRRDLPGRIAAEERSGRLVEGNDRPGDLVVEPADGERVVLHLGGAALQAGTEELPQKEAARSPAEEPDQGHNQRSVRIALGRARWGLPGWWRWWDALRVARNRAGDGEHR
jgi:hypothetical protein